ncbi:DEAD/DEAH box helicase [Demequina subtropica]|uniref:DEAD/DEAH box helicase n=1 Tax=Demequina subtropica TaxID=1638989 RepID=UPI000782DF3F|nr:DEAD/DEAH box helicase family protein [Demequina subtropica]
MTTDIAVWRPDPSLVAEVSRQFERTIDSYKIHPDLISEHANHEESIRTGGYANRTLLELVQNAADALAGTDAHALGDAAGRVEIVLDPDMRTLYCANAGRPFSTTGLTAITMAHLSGKRGDEIGRFGLGFKSVLAISDAPQVFSRSVSFEFNSPDARAALSRVGSGVRRFPVLRTATLIDPATEFANDEILAGLGAWAATVVKLPNITDIERLKREIEDFSDEFLLFVGAVREVKLRVLGDEGFETSHVSRDLGDGRLRIERPNGEGDTWFVGETMHAPSAEARRQVGEAVSRAEVKVTVAVPERQVRQRIGQFWSYFPLQDKTSASALFNAPWSVNDDRTTLLRNDYNKEILRTVSALFVDLLPKVRDNDPAAHLDYMPARGREILSFGDEVLIAHIPQIAAKRDVIPDATGRLRHVAELRPLDFEVSLPSDVHEAWCASPNTGDDVPHPKCYATPTRVNRVRDLFIADIASSGIDPGGRELKRALDHVNKRGALSWFREWAEGSDPRSSAEAFRVAVTQQGKIEAIATAKVVPTTAGFLALKDKDVVFLNKDVEVDIEGAIFVDPAFLAEPGVEADLRHVGFRDLDPESILHARLARMSVPPNAAELPKLWDAVMDVAVPVAVRVLNQHRAKVMVPTKDGGWSWPTQVFDLAESFGAEFDSRILDHERCLPAVAHKLGVVRTPVENFAFEDEPMAEDYRRYVLSTLESSRGPGERPTERIDLTPSGGPGPVSMLFMLRDVDAPAAIRESWTSDLLDRGDRAWVCEDLDTGRTYAVKSPARWAVEDAGLLPTTRGPRRPADVAAASLVRYDGLLPLFRGPRQVGEALELPSELEALPQSMLREALDQDLYPPTLKDDVLVEFILAATTHAFSGTKPPSVPARVGRMVEARPTNTVYLATSDEQQAFLAARQKPYLRVADGDVDQLVSRVGCKSVEDGLSFSMFTEGEQDRERILDVFPGLRHTLVAAKVANATISRAAVIVKRVTFEDGVEDQSHEALLDGVNLVIRSSADEREALRFVNTEFDLQLNNAELDAVLKAGLDQMLEGMRHEAQAATTDAERLDVYFGPDELREALPKGLWSALEAQALVDDGTSVSELFLTVYGSDSIRMLADAFRDIGFPDVPDEWAGRPATVAWLRKMSFGSAFAGRRNQRQVDEFVVPGAVILNPLHSFQEKISRQLRDVLTLREADGRALKAMVELPTGAGKTRVASETVLRLFKDDRLNGPILWIAQSQELCEQAVQTFSTVWRGLGDERPLTIGRLWENHIVHEPDTEFSVIVATDAKLDKIIGNSEYAWLRDAAAVIIDEGHRAGDSRLYTRLLEWLGIAGRGWERPLVGLSATPFKGTSESATKALASRFGNRKIDAFDGDAYTQLAELGVLARVKHEVLQGVDVSLLPGEADEVRSLRRISPAVLNRVGRDQQRMSILVDHILRQDESWPVLVFTPNVLSAQVLAATLRYRGRAADSVSGQTGRQQRRDVIEQFKAGEIQILANCDLLIQGFDAPGVRALYIARPTFSPNAYIQMAGRGLRGPENGGKDECLIVDMADNFGDVSDYLGYREYEDLWREQGS